MPSWLWEGRIRLCLGHSGNLCPVRSMCMQQLCVLNHILNLVSQKRDDKEECQEGSSSEDDTEAQLSFSSAKPGRYDKEGHPIITVVDRSGIHEIGVSWCCCSGAP